MSHASNPAESNPSAPQPPIARRDPTSTTLHGVTLHDDFRWMRDKNSPELLAYLERRERLHRRRHGSHCRVTDQALRRDALPHPGDRRERPLPSRRLVLHHPHRQGQPISHPLPPRRCQPRSQLRLRPDPARTGHPGRKPARRGQAIHGRRSHGHQPRRQPPRLLHRFHRLPPVHAPHPRPAHRSPTSPDTAERVGSLAWAADSRTLFYSTEDETTKRQDSIFRHTLGAALRRRRTRLPRSRTSASTSASARPATASTS